MLVSGQKYYGTKTPRDLNVTTVWETTLCPVNSSICNNHQGPHYANSVQKKKISSMVSQTSTKFNIHSPERWWITEEEPQSSRRLWTRRETRTARRGHGWPDRGQLWQQRRAQWPRGRKLPCGRRPQCRPPRRPRNGWRGRYVGEAQNQPSSSGSLPAGWEYGRLMAIKN